MNEQQLFGLPTHNRATVLKVGKNPFADGSRPVVFKLESGAMLRVDLKDTEIISLAKAAIPDLFKSDREISDFMLVIPNDLEIDADAIERLEAEQARRRAAGENAYMDEDAIREFIASSA